jgi:hypothetical protein
MGSKPNRLGDPCFDELDDPADGSFGVVGWHEVEVAFGSGWVEVRDRALVDAVGAAPTRRGRNSGRGVDLTHRRRQKRQSLAAKY